MFAKIGSSYTSDQFPSEFSNQLYFSENVSLGEYSYRSSYSIKFVLSGYENYSVAGRELFIKPGQHLLVNNLSKITTLPATGKALSIFIAPETLRDVVNITLSETLYKDIPDPDHQGELFLFHEKTYGQENARTHFNLNCLANELLSENISGENEVDPGLFFKVAEGLVLDQWNHSNRLSKLCNKKASTTQEQYSRLLRGLEYLNDCWNRPYSLKETAAIAMLSPYHFHRLFKLSFHTTPYNYHLQHQMKKAMMLIKANQKSISEICAFLGFESVTAFGRTFKKFYGAPPSVFQTK